MSVVTPGVQEIDVLLFVFRTDKNEEITDIITYTQHKVDDVSMYIHTTYSMRHT